MKPILNTKSKDRQSQVKIVFTIMAILCGDEWLTIEDIRSKLQKKGFKRCSKTVKRLLTMLRELNFNLLCNKKIKPFRYKGHKRKMFLMP